jgi:hypothetical protein
MMLLVTSCSFYCQEIGKNLTIELFLVWWYVDEGGWHGG